VSFRPVGPPPDQRPPGIGGRLLGGPDSWRRVVLAGLGGGIALAAVAAFAMALIDDDSGALETQAPTPAAPVAGPVDDGGDVAPAEDVPAEDTPVEGAPSEEAPPADEQPPAEAPPTEPPPTVAEPPTEVPPPTEPVATPAVEEPTAAATAEGG
jgi:hypothetical protein